MKTTIFFRTTISIVLTAFVLVSSIYAQNPATTPANRNVKRHAAQVAQMEKGDIDLLMIGDSITHLWEEGGKDVWNKYYSHRKPINLGINGDQTQHVLWRLDHLPLDKISPKVAVVMIGTNNIGNKTSSPKETADGIKAIVERLETKYPTLKILVLNVFPRGEKPDNGLRKKVDEINSYLPELFKDKPNVTLLDINSTFLNTEKVLTKEIMYDFLHPSAEGYALWAKAMEPTLAAMLNENKNENKNETKYPRRVLPLPEQVLWQNMEQIMFVHFDPSTWQNREGDNLTIPLDQIHPTKLDVNQWIDAAEAFDAKMILFVAKHAGGFCWWQTETTDYSIKNTPYKNGKGDILDELAQACFKRGMKLGIYICPADKKHNIGDGGKAKDAESQEKYNKILRTQWEEVLSRYGNQIAEIWFDGSVVIPLEDIVKKYSSRAIVFQGPFATIRWVGNERGFCPYPNWYTLKEKDAKTGVATAIHSDPNGDVWSPVEVDTTLRNHFWFWRPTNEKNLRSLDELMTIYYQSVGRGAMLLLNSAPNTDGLIPEKDMERYREFGNEIKRRFGKSVAETSGKGLLVELKLPESVTIDHAIIQEEISMGQRVRKYEIEGLINNQWKLLAQGQSVGQKRIEQFESVKVDAVRLRVTESSFPPVIKRFAIFNTGAAINEQISNTENKPEKDAGEIIVTENGQFEFDLSPFIPFAEQYVLSIKSGSAIIPVEKLFLQIHGTDLSEFVTILEDGTVRLNITGAPDMKPKSIMIRGNLKQKQTGKYRLFVK